MADAAVRERWSRTSNLLALIANVNRDPKKTKAFSADDFNPLVAKTRTTSGRGIPLTKNNLIMLKHAFVDRQTAATPKKGPIPCVPTSSPRS